MSAYINRPRMRTPDSPLGVKRGAGVKDSELTKVRQSNVVNSWLQVAGKQRRKSVAAPSRPEDHLESITDEVLRQVTGLGTRSFEQTMAAIASRLRASMRLPERLVILPEEPWKRSWDLFVILLVVYSAILLPLTVAFPDSQSSLPWNVSGVLIDLIFLCDMVLHARTALPTSDGSLEMSGKVIMVYYLRGWFTIDFLATVPFDYILGGLLGESATAIAFVGILKCLRLLRLGRVLRYIQHLQYANMWRVARLVAFYVMFLHWCSCLWFFVGTVQSSKRAWVEREDVGNGSYWGQYWQSAAHIAQIVGGANLSNIETTVERVVGTVLFVVGAVFNATLFGQVALLLQNRNSVHQAYQDKMDAVNQNLRLLGLPTELQQRVRHFYDYSFHQHRMLDYKEFVEGLSPTLGGEVSLYIHRDMVERVPIFQGCSSDFVVDLVGSLAHRVYLPDDLIVRYGEHGDEMFFINTGTCQVLSKNRHRVIARLFRRDYFGELALMTDAPRTATVQAETYCDVSYLSRRHLDALCAAYPDMARRIQAEAAARIKQWRRTLKNASSMHNVARVALVADKVAAEFLARVRARIAARQGDPTATRKRVDASSFASRSTEANVSDYESSSPKLWAMPSAMSPRAEEDAEVQQQVDTALLSLDCSAMSLMEDDDESEGKAEVPQLAMPPSFTMPPNVNALHLSLLSPVHESPDDREDEEQQAGTDSDRSRDRSSADSTNHTISRGGSGSYCGSPDQAEEGSKAPSQDAVLLDVTPTATNHDAPMAAQPTPGRAAQRLQHPRQAQPTSLDQLAAMMQAHMRTMEQHMSRMSARLDAMELRLPAARE